MSLNHVLSLGIVLAAAGALAGCGDSGSGSAAMSGATTAKPAMSGSATAAMTATATAAPTATATAAPTASATAAAIVGIASGEMVAAVCNSVDKDSECAEVVVTKDADKAKSMDVMKKLCKGTVSETACSMDKIVGTCRVMKDIINHYSSEGPKKYTADTAKKECEKNHGKWVTP